MEYFHAYEEFFIISVFVSAGYIHLGLQYSTRFIK